MNFRAIHRTVHYGNDIGNRQVLIDLNSDDRIRERLTWKAVVQDGCYGIFRPTTLAPSTTTTTSMTTITTSTTPTTTTTTATTSTTTISIERKVRKWSWNHFSSASCFCKEFLTPLSFHATLWSLVIQYYCQF